MHDLCAIWARLREVPRGSCDEGPGGGATGEGVRRGGGSAEDTEVGGDKEGNGGFLGDDHFS